MFTYCTERLGLSADAAQKWIQVARACRRFPELLERLAAGDIHLSGLSLLAPHLRPGNVAGLLARATGKSKRDIEILVAEIAPRPDAASTVRKLPGPRRAEPTAPAAPSCPSPSPGTQSAPVPAQAAAPPADLSALAPALPHPTAATRPVIEPLAPARYKVQFTAGQELHDSARGMLEYDHIIPYTLGGPATVANTRLRCAVHNRLEAEEKFGAASIAQMRLFG